MSAEPIHLANEPSPFDALRIDIDDLLLEARNWADGEPATSQEQVDEIARLADALNDRAKLLDAERVREKKPLDDQIAAIQDRYNVYLAPLKNKQPGRVPVALDALSAAKRPFLLAEEARIRATAEDARQEAEAKARAAQEAIRAATANDIDAREKADAKAREAEAAQAAARQAEKAKAHAHGGGRAQGLRTRVVAEITDLDAAVRFYWTDNREAFRDLVQRLADTDARQNRRAADGKGLIFREERA